MEKIKKLWKAFRDYKKEGFLWGFFKGALIVVVPVLLILLVIRFWYIAVLIFFICWWSFEKKVQPDYRFQVIQLLFDILSNQAANLYLVSPQVAQDIMPTEYPFVTLMPDRSRRVCYRFICAIDPKASGINLTLIRDTVQRHILQNVQNGSYVEFYNNRTGKSFLNVVDVRHDACHSKCVQIELLFDPFDKGMTNFFTLPPRNNIMFINENHFNDEDF